MADARFVKQWGRNYSRPGIQRLQVNKLIGINYLQITTFMVCEYRFGAILLFRINLNR